MITRPVDTPSGRIDQPSPSTRPEAWTLDSRRRHADWVILDSDWEAEFLHPAPGRALARV